MMLLILWVFTAAAFDPAVIESAAEAELSRAMAGLKLPDAAAPHHITVRIDAGEYAEVWAGDGVLYLENGGPFRGARVDVRVGDALVDSGNFQAALGKNDGTVLRGLAHEDNVASIRRELWLAMDVAYKGATETLAAKRSARDGRALSHTADFSEEVLVGRAVDAWPGIDADALKRRVRSIAAAVLGQTHIEDSTVGGQAAVGQKLVHDSAGTMAWIPMHEVVIRASVYTAAKDGARLKNVRSWVARDLAHLPSAVAMEASLQDAVEWLKLLKDAPVGGDYLGPVLFEAEASAELFRQLLQPQVAGTPPMESAPEGADVDARPIPTARVGRRLLPVGWSVRDNPKGDVRLASYSTHDFDAVATRAVSLVEDGVTRDVLMSRVPRADRAKSTGHGRGMGSDRIEAMPTQITVHPARGLSTSRLRKQALRYAKAAGLPFVLVVRRIVPPSMDNGFEFAFTGDGPLAGLTAPAEVYRLYLDGREEPVRGMQFVGVDRRTLRDIVASGRTGPAIEMNDVPGASRRFGLAWFDGFPVSWAVPPVLIGEVELHGRSGGEARILAAPEPIR
jgi:hypothetical protein